MAIYQSILEKRLLGKKSLAILIDPDKMKSNDIYTIVDLANLGDVDYFFVGGSLLLEDELHDTVTFLKRHSDIPVILFPGGETQLHPDADAILFLSLISGRNPEYLIGKQVIAAPKVKKIGLEAISTGYMLIHGLKQSSSSYITHSLPIPPSKPEIAVATALASQYLGHQMIYLEGGSGALKSISPSTVKMVKDQIDIPIIVGGGIKTSTQMDELYSNGADLLVIGTSIEKKPYLVKTYAETKARFNYKLADS